MAHSPGTFIGSKPASAAKTITYLKQADVGHAVAEALASGVTGTGEPRGH